MRPCAHGGDADADESGATALAVLFLASLVEKHMAATVLSHIFDAIHGRFSLFAMTACFFAGCAFGDRWPDLMRCAHACNAWNACMHTCI